MRLRIAVDAKADAEGESDGDGETGNSNKLQLLRISLGTFAGATLDVNDVDVDVVDDDDVDDDVVDDDDDILEFEEVECNKLFLEFELMARLSADVDFTNLSAADGIAMTTGVLVA
jgi:hypothetical protein